MQQAENVVPAKVVTILAIIDTGYVKQTYPQPSQDPEQPTVIDHASQFMLCAGSRGMIAGQGTANLEFRANIGDYVAFTGTSIYDNADDAVIVYSVDYSRGKKVFNQFSPVLVTRDNAVMPDPDSETGIPPTGVSATFSSQESRVHTHGTGYYNLSFALYALAADGETQELFGYYRWASVFTVLNHHF